MQHTCKHVCLCLSEIEVTHLHCSQTKKKAQSGAEIQCFSHTRVFSFSEKLGHYMKTIDVGGCIFCSSCCYSSTHPIFYCVILLIITSVFEHPGIDALFWKKPWSTSKGILEAPCETCLSSSVFMFWHWNGKTGHSSAIRLLFTKCWFVFV